ncbi:MAG: hypothetical protein FMNOHCHN_02045 [Ignavibacteriaceae bacterium]|nr:hypothetical protein [Ignavibacteriaceae bacterium]
MKKLILLCLFIALSSSMTGQSSRWSAVLSIEPYPTSFLTVWQSNPGTSGFTAVYTGTTAVDYRLQVTLKNDRNKELIRGRSPLESFTSGPDTRFYQSSDLLTWSDITYDNTTFQQIIRTNRFPEGDYTINVKILASNGTTLLAEATGNFTIIYPDSPVLFGPQNQSTVDFSAPVFTWAQVNLPVTITATYDLRIVERLSGQSPTQALRVNPAHHSADVSVTGSYYVYPADALPFVNGKEYVWRIRVLDENGDPLTSNDGNSEFWTFTFFSPNTPGSTLPFNSVEIERNVAWFSDFSQTQITADEQNYIVNGATTLNIRLSDGVTREFPAMAVNLAFRKDRYSPFIFSSGSISADIPEGTLPAELITTHFKPQGIEYNTDDKLFLKGQAQIPGGRSPILIPGIVRIKPGGILDATIRHRSGGSGGQGGGGSSGYIQSPDNGPGDAFASIGGFVGIGSNPVTSASPVLNNRKDLFAGAFLKNRLEGEPIYTFGNSAVRINITEYELIYPEAVAKFAGEVIIFNNQLAAKISNIRFNAAGELTGTIDTTNPLNMNFISSEAGKYQLSIQGVSGTFSYEPVSQVSSIDLTLKNAKFVTNVANIFSQTFTGSAAVTANLVHSSTSPDQNGFQISSLGSFTTEVTTLTNHAVAFGPSYHLGINSLTLDSLTYSGGNFDFKMTMSLIPKLPGLQLSAAAIDGITYTKRGIALPGIYSRALESDVTGGNNRNIDGYSVTFSKISASEVLYNGGTTNPGLTVEAGIRFLNFPTGSSEDLFTLDIPANAEFSRTGFSITIPARNFTSSFIAIPGGLSFNLASMQGTIGGTLSNGVYTYTSNITAKGKLSLPSGVFGASAEEELDLSAANFRLNGRGIVTGSASNISKQNAPKVGLFTITSANNFEIFFDAVNDTQKVTMGRSGRMNLEPLTGTSTDASVDFRFDLIANEFQSLSGTVSGTLNINLPASGSGFTLKATGVRIDKNGISVTGRQNVQFGSETDLSATASQVLFSFTDAALASGKIVIDKGFAIRADLRGGDNSPVFTFGNKNSAAPGYDGVNINTPDNTEYTSSGINIPSGNDSIFVSIDGIIYKGTVVYNQFVGSFSPLKAKSGSAELLIRGIQFGTITSSGLTIDRSALPVLPEKIALLNNSIAEIKIKDGSSYLVDYTHETGGIRIKTKPNTPLNVNFNVMKFNNDNVAPAVPVTLDLLLDKNNYDIIDGTISADIPGNQLVAFMLSRKEIPASLRNFRYAKNASGLYELTFGSVIRLFNQEVNAGTNLVNLQVDGSGLLTGDVSLTSTRRASFGHDSNNGARLALNMDTVSGSFQTQLLNFTAPDYEFTIKGGLKFLLRPTPSFLYKGINARFVVTHGNIQINDVTTDDFGSDKLDLGRLKILFSAMRVPSLNYVNNKWIFAIELDGSYHFDISGSELKVPSVKKMTYKSSGFTLPEVQINNLEESPSPLSVSGYSVQVRNFRSGSLAIQSFAPALVNSQLPNANMKFDLTISSSQFPESWPADLRGMKFYMQNASLNTQGLLTGKSDAQKFLNPKTLTFAANRTGLQLDSVFAQFGATNAGVQTLAAGINGGLIVPKELRGVNADAVVPLASSLNLAANGDITGVVFAKGVGALQSFLRMGRIAIDVAPLQLRMNFNVTSDTASVLMWNFNRAGSKIYLWAKSGLSYWINRTGNFWVFNLGTEKFEQGTNVLFGNVNFFLPVGKESLTLFSPGGNSVLTHEGIEVKNASLTLDGRNAPLTGTLRVSDKDFSILGGSLTHKGALAAEVAAGAGWTYWKLRDTNYTLTWHSSALLRVKSFTLSADGVQLRDSISADLRSNNQTYKYLSLSVKNNPVISLPALSLTEPQLFDIYKGTTRTAYIDHNGINIVALPIPPVPERLALGSETNAYIVLKNGTNELVNSQEVSNGVRYTNKPGQTLRLVVPGLKYGQTTDPEFTLTSLDVTVNKSSFAFVSGTVSVQAAAGQVLLDLSGRGIPFQVTGIKYTSGQLGYTLTADGKTKLPDVLSAINGDLTNIPFNEGKLSGFVSNGAVTEGYSPSAGYKKSALIGTTSVFKLQGVEYTFGDQPSYRVSGAIMSKLFKHNTSDTSGIHFVASYTNNNFAFTLSPGNIDGLNMNRLKMVPQAVGASPAMAITFTQADFSLVMNGVIKASQISANFESTIRGLTITKNNVTAQNSNDQQEFEMFGQTFRVQQSGAVPAISFSYLQDIFAMNMNGTMKFAGQNAAFRGLQVNSSGTLAFAAGAGNGFTVTPSARLTLLNDRLWVNGLSLVTANNATSLQVTGTYKLPAPATQTEQAYTYSIPSNQRSQDAFNAVLLNQGPGLAGTDPTRTDFWAGKYDVYYVGLNLDLEEPANSELQMVSIFYVDGEQTQKNIQFGSVSGGTVEPGLAIAFNNSHTWIDELSVSQACDFKYRNLRFDLDEQDIGFDTTTNGGFMLTIEGSATLGITGFSGTLNFDGLEVLSTNVVRNLGSSITGGSIEGGETFSASITNVGFSADPTTIYIPDPNGRKETTGPNAGAVITIAQPVNFFLRFGGSMRLGGMGEGSLDSLLIYTTRLPNGATGGSSFVIKNFEFKKYDKFEFKLNMTQLSGQNGDFVVIVGGFVKVNETGFAAAGKLAKWQGKFSAGIFLAATEGLNIKIGPVEITGVGGGFFYNPTDADITLVRNLCDFDDEYTAPIRSKVAGAPVTQPPLFAAFVYGAVAIGDKGLLAGRAMLTVSNTKLIVDARVDVLERKEEIYGLLNIEIGFTQFYAEGTLAVTLKMAEGYLLAANGQTSFFFYSTSNWGMIGSFEFQVLKGVLRGTGEFYAGNKGFYAGVAFSGGFDVWVVSVSGGMQLKAWYKPNISWGGYFSIYLRASVLGGIASASGEVKGVMLGKPEFALAGGVSLRIRLLFISWSGDVWIRLKRDGIRAGFGKDDAVQRLIAEAERTSNDMLAAVQAAKQDMINNKPIPALGVTPEVINQASSQLLKLLQKSRSIPENNRMTAAEKDSLRQWRLSESIESNGGVMNYIVRLEAAMLDEGRDARRTELVNLINEVNTAINEYKTAVSNMSTALSQYTLTVEVPAAGAPEGVEDPVSGTSFVYPTVRSVEPQPNAPTFNLNEATFIQNNTLVNGYMASAENFHDILKRNMEKIETAITKFDEIFKQQNNTYLAIGDKFVAVEQKVQNYFRRLAEYYFEDVKGSQDIRTMISDSTSFLNAIDQTYPPNNNLTELKKKVYRRWGRIRTLSGNFSTPWDHSMFDNAWNSWGNDRRRQESKSQAGNLYVSIPANAFTQFKQNRLDLLRGVHTEFRNKVANINEMAAAYTRLLDELFAKRRKMSENLFEVTERFIYWKNGATTNNYDRSVDYRTMAPTITTLNQKRTALIASNTAPQLSISGVTVENKRSHGVYTVNWSGSHPDGIAEYSVEYSKPSVNNPDYGMYAPFRSINKRTTISGFEVPQYGGEYNDGRITLKIRARAGSGFTLIRPVNVSVPLGFTDTNMGTLPGPQNNTIPVDNTGPYVIAVTAHNIYDTQRSRMLFRRQPYNENYIRHYVSSETDKIKISFSASDNESGINSYEYRIVKRNNLDSLETIRDWTNIGAVNEYLIQGLNLKHLQNVLSASAIQSRVTSQNYDMERYVISIRAKNGAGLYSYKENGVAIIIDTTKAPPITFINQTVNHTLSIKQSWQLVLGRQVTVPLEAPSTFNLGDFKIWFPMNFPTNVGEYIYKVYAMPGDIPVYDDWVRDTRTYYERRNNIWYQMKEVLIPYRFINFKKFRLEIAYKTITGAYSDLAVSENHLALPFTNSGNDIYDAGPRRFNVDWFTGIPPGHTGSLPNGNINLYFKILSWHETGIERYEYTINFPAANGLPAVWTTSWRDIGPIPDDRIVRMGPDFFSGIPESALVPGRSFEVRMRAVSRNLRSWEMAECQNMILPPKPPIVPNFSISPVKKVNGPYVWFEARVSFNMNAIVPQGQQMKYYMKAEVFRNGRWETDPGGVEKLVWTQVPGQTGNLLIYDTWTGYFTKQMIPFRNANSSGNAPVSGAELWRVSIKMVNQDGLESPVATKEFVW